MVEEVKTEELVVAGGNSFDYPTIIATLEPAERTRLLALTDKVTQDDITSVQMYGSELSQLVSKNSDSLLEKVRANDSGEVIALTTDLLNKLEVMNLDSTNEIELSGWRKYFSWLPFARKMEVSTKQILNRYDYIANNIEKTAKKLDIARMVALRNNTMLQEIFNDNTTYIKDVRELILGLKLKEEQVINEIKELEKDPRTEPIQLQDKQMFLTAIQRKIADLQVSETSFGQTQYQIRLGQMNNTSIANEASNIATNVIPLWKQNITFAIMMNDQKNHVGALKEIKGTTNEILKRNSAAVKNNTIAVAKANEEMVISLETIQRTTDDLIQTITEVKRIQAEGAKNREQLEASLRENVEKLMDAVQDAALVSHNKK